MVGSVDGTNYSVDTVWPISAHIRFLYWQTFRNIGFPGVLLVN